MTSEFDAALFLTMLSFPNTICITWKALSLLYWFVATQRDLWNDSGNAFGHLLTVMGLSALTEGPIACFPFDRPAIVSMKVLNQGLLCILLVHNMREERTCKMSASHRMCYALLVENGAAFNLSWNYVQTATLVSALLAQGFGVGPDVVSSLDLVLLAIYVLFTVSVELVFLRKFRWTLAAHIPIQLWVLTFYQNSVLDGKAVCVLFVLNALLVLKKITPERFKFLTFSLEKNQDKDVEQQPSELEV
ncbi:Hypp1512 [Branchiostoma lanceolatum]|uniref:Hypp1512 protein n=1 Tax=Branchiostoma lanceolatum TaxID=7740 RepID=A0A8K0EL49_BRALA|nr:Hypp1512 [Branchiostoma lanceolatum]